MSALRVGFQAAGGDDRGLFRQRHRGGGAGRVDAARAQGADGNTFQEGMHLCRMGCGCRCVQYIYNHVHMYVDAYAYVSLCLFIKQITVRNEHVR